MYDVAMERAALLQADWTWVGDSFQPDVQVEVGRDGMIRAVGRLNMPATLRLPNRALLPGFVNAHSHAFQRDLRGKGESFPSGSGSFWTWREEMYGLVSSLSADRLFQLSTRAFREMLAGGITSVGEFHYYHHDDPGQGYGLDEVVLQAAQEAGIRIVLLNAFYRTGGIGSPLAGAQRRFETRTASDYWRQMDRLEKNLSSSRQSLGAAVHSLRAAPPEDILEIHREAKIRKMPFHMHVEEQRREIEDSRKAYGAPPMPFLLDLLEIGPEFTAVHCTHTAPSDLTRCLDRGGNVCICPTTEANLGDGIADLGSMAGRASQLCVGTDSNSRICLMEELRWLEYAQRLRSESRGVLRAEAGRVAPRLLGAGSQGGADSLGLRAGRIAAGAAADFLVVDLSAPELEGWTPERLPEAFVFGSGNQVVDSVCVAGQWVFQRQSR